MRLETATNWTKYILYAVLLVLLAAGCWWGWQKLHPPAVPVISTTQQAASTTAGVQQAAQQAHIPVSRAQASSIARQIADSVDEEPVATVQTTGSEWEATAQKIGKATKSDFVMVTDPKRPDQQPTPKPTDCVQQNVYAIHAYPEYFWTARADTDRNFGVGYAKKIKVFGAVGYLGPDVSVFNRGTVRVGLQLMIPEQPETKKKTAQQVQAVK